MNSSNHFTILSFSFLYFYSSRILNYSPSQTGFEEKVEKGSHTHMDFNVSSLSFQKLVSVQHSTVTHKRN